MFYKIAKNPELENTEPLLLADIQGLGSCQPLITMFSISQSAHSLVLFVFLCKDTLFNMPEGSFSNMYLYSFLALRNTRQHFSTILGGHFQQQNHQQKVHSCKKHDTK